MIMEINPVSNLKLKLQSGHEIIVEAGFQRIFDGEDVQNVMVLFQDMTDIVRTKEALEAEKLIRESELEQIAAILQHGPGVFEDFITSADSAYKLILKYEDSLNDENSLGMVFREIHSLKGTARYLKFRRLEEVSHELENHFEQLRKGAEKVLNPEEMQPLIDSMRAEIDSIRTTVERFKQFSIGNGPDDSESAVFKSRLSEMITELAGELDKSAQLKLESNMEIIPGLRKLQPAIFHLVRNAVDHGIEDKFQRTSERKNETAVIGLSFNAEDGVLRIVVSDDGRGIDFDAVEKRAVEKGLLNPGPNDHKQVLTAMFSSGFSSRDVVSTVSGRGVGLDAMQAAVNKLNGKIKVITKKGKGTSFILAIPLKNLEAAG
jgi:two-component system chemotaxis sensor kinase CheA